MAPREPMVGQWQVYEPTAADYRRLAAVVLDVAGIALNETKMALVTRRLSPRVRELGFDAFGEYVAYACGPGNDQEMMQMLDLITTNETHFFREPEHFTFLETRVLPAWRAAADAGRRPPEIRLWSAACSTGQEAYSLAMQLLWQCPPAHGWRLEILATDLSTRALSTARDGEWSIERANEIPEHFRHQFMLRGVGERQGRMRAKRVLRDSIRFARLNLNEQTYDVRGTFDLIFCRNVLIYFSPEGRARVIDRLASHLAPGGLLFLGHAESLHGHRERLRAVAPTVYERVA